MTLTEWLEAAPGRLSAMAAQLGITHSAVSQWKRNGVPLARMREVADITDGAVSFEELLQEMVARESG